MNEIQERIDLTGFGKIRIMQDRKGFCYGIDAVLVADFVKVKKGGRIADLGCGTGIIPLILCHKTEAGEIVGFEIQKSAADLAVRNVALNGLEERIRILNINITQALTYCKACSFDVVVSNPPYTADQHGLKSESDSRRIARHEVTASLEDFTRTAAALLKPRGEFVLTHRPARLADIMTACRHSCLEPKEIRFVYPNEQADEPNIMLLRCRKNGGAELKFAPPLYVYDQEGSYTEAIKRIYEKKEPSQCTHWDNPL